MYDSSTMLGLLFAVARTEGWSEDTWVTRRDQAIGEFLSPEREAATRRGASVLTREIERWERELAESSTPLADPRGDTD